MFEGLKDMGKLLKQAKEMKGQMKKVQDELKKMIVTASSAGGKVEVEMTGELECTSIKISPDLCQPNQTALLQKAVKEAVNAATKKSKELAAKKLAAISGDLNLPGL